MKRNQVFLAVVFKYCDDHKWALIDLKDLKKSIAIYHWRRKKQHSRKSMEPFPTTSVGAIMRKIVELEQQGAEVFFGERSF